MGAEWWTSPEEYRFIETYVVVIMCLLANLIEILFGAFRKWVSEGHGQTVAEPQWFQFLFMRANTELTVLGFLAFLVWIFARAGVFDSMVVLMPHPYAGCSTYSSSSHRQLAAASASSSSVNEEYCAYINAQTVYGRHILHYPIEGTQLLHIVEDVHMQIFIAMCLYFTLMGVTISITKKTCDRWVWWEENMREYAHFPTNKRPATFSRLIHPLSDVKDFFKAKAYFIEWARSGALRDLEGHRARRHLREATKAKRIARIMSASSKLFRQRGLSSAANSEARATNDRKVSAGRIELALKTGGGEHSGGDNPSPGNDNPHQLENIPNLDQRINEDFSFGAYLSLGYAELLGELIEFEPGSWSFVLIIAILEGMLLYVGFDSIQVDLGFAVCTATLVFLMGLVSKALSGAMLRAAERGKVMRTPPWVNWFMNRFNVDSFFLRLLQALTWRSLFRIVVFLVGELTLQPKFGAKRIATLVILLTSTVTLPAIAFDWCPLFCSE